MFSFSFPPFALRPWMGNFSFRGINVRNDTKHARCYLNKFYCHHAHTERGFHHGSGSEDRAALTRNQVMSGIRRKAGRPTASASNGLAGMHLKKQRSIVRDWNGGFRPWAICKDYSISEDMLAAVLYEQGVAKSRSDAKLRIRIRKPKVRKLETILRNG